MIPFASQRGAGQDLAIHLLNEYDNEYQEVAEIRGAIARDLNGAFAEWELQARTLTKCKNYIYSLSINPDPVQGPLTRDQYMDFINRTEEKLGLTGQPRAVVFHIKNGREHCHVAWSRIDPTNRKAIHMAFDHDKLMMVTRGFARDHGLTLPAGYEHHEKRQERERQVTLYERYQQNQTGLSKESRMAHITEAWQRSDSPKAFVQALARRGYILATGNRPYVLVDLYGHTNSLAKMIADKSVRTKDVRAFLEKEFPPGSLPTIEEAKALVAKHREAQKDFKREEQRSTEVEYLKKHQAARRALLESQHEELRARQSRELAALAETHREGRAQLRSGFLNEANRIRSARFDARPSGLAGFLSKVSGLSLIRKKIHEYQDKKRTRAFVGTKEELRTAQRQEEQILQRRHEMQAFEFQRKRAALEQLDKRELRSLETSQTREDRIVMRRGRDRMPSLTLDLKPPGRPAAPHKAMNRFTSPTRQELLRTASRDTVPQQRDFDLTDEFSRAAGESRSVGDGRSSSGGPVSAERQVVRRRNDPQPSTHHRKADDGGPERAR